MTTRPWFRHDPQAVKDYGVDWSAWLDDGETLVSSEWESDDLTLAGESFTTTRTSVFVSGGVAGGRYSITNRVVTSAGKTDDRTLHFHIENT